MMPASNAQKKHKMNISKLENLADLDLADILSQADHYTAESFEEMDGKLVAMMNADPKNAFVVGAITRAGWDSEAKHQGKVVARNSRNTGWGFVVDSE